MLILPVELFPSGAPLWFVKYCSVVTIVLLYQLELQNDVIYLGNGCLATASPIHYLWVM